MQHLLGLMRKAITEYDMISPGDKIAVGVSGGKDSVALLVGLSRLRAFIGIPYGLTAVTLDPNFNGIPTDYTPIADLCASLEIPFVCKNSQIGEIIFQVRQEENPCSLCARMRRGLLHDTAVEYGCNKVALGHHYDDAVETFLMNLFREGRIGCFSPVTYLSRKQITMIRPLILAEEKEISRAVKKENIPVVKSRCPADGYTSRQWTKEWLRDMEKTMPGIKKRIFGAMRRAHIDRW